MKNPKLKRNLKNQSYWARLTNRWHRYTKESSRDHFYSKQIAVHQKIMDSSKTLSKRK